MTDAAHLRLTSTPPAQSSSLAPHPPAPLGAPPRTAGHLRIVSLRSKDLGCHVERAAAQGVRQCCRPQRTRKPKVRNLQLGRGARVAEQQVAGLEVALHGERVGVAGLGSQEEATGGMCKWGVCKAWVFLLDTVPGAWRICRYARV